MRRSVVLVALVSLLGGCDLFGAPAPLVPLPQWQASDGPAVQFHASRNQGQFQIDGVAQGVASLEIKLVRQGQIVADKTLSIGSSDTFSSSIGPVQDGDEVTLQAPGYSDTLDMTWPNTVVDHGPALDRPVAASSSAAV